MGGRGKHRNVKGIRDSAGTYDPHVDSRAPRGAIEPCSRYRRDDSATRSWNVMSQVMAP